MADIICCEVVIEGDTSVSCDPSSRAARRRRMDIRRFKFIPDVSVTPSENGKKRLKLTNDPSPQPRNRENADTNCSYYGAQHGLECESGRPDQPNENSSRVLYSKETPSEQTITNLSSDLPPVPVLPVVSDRCPQFGATAVCGRRREMEDAVAIHPSLCRENSQISARLHFFGLYDGHGCSHVAMSCKDRMHQLVKEELENREASPEWKDAMERSFSRMDKEVLRCRNGALPRITCRCDLQMPQCDAVGSTAVVSIVTPDKIVVANCGDSRAVLSRGGKAVPLSTDHKPDLPEELLRIQDAGGRVIYWDGPRVLGVLAMSRAIGDNYLKPYVSSEPEVTITERTEEDECLILASDGLWDVVSNDTVCGIVRMCLNGQGPVLPRSTSSSSSSAGNEQVQTVFGGGENQAKACSDAAMLLTKLALARRSTDNVSVIVVDLRRST
ncbi:Protein phosphatase 2C (PP2C)-like domain [Macleaya cordata]|uniref:protein-serine/threonine phosphatase n=1 Tax=Macleaya cordata TaxID=56857 RepID=A0A200QYK8_MACCD|nr:Protein phosphatase 2C (PP2C)-like domain [Macleaya cordata]